jgi:hypothetical protein
MATNRLYIVNTDTKEYCCIAKSSDYVWNFGNAKILDKLLSETCGISYKTTLIIGTENDDVFYNKWIKDGININKNNEWVYYEQ